MQHFSLSPSAADIFLVFLVSFQLIVHMVSFSSLSLGVRAFSRVDQLVIGGSAFFWIFPLIP